MGQLQNVALVNGVAFHSRFDVDQVGADEFGHRDRVDFLKIKSGCNYFFLHFPGYSLTTVMLTI